MVNKAEGTDVYTFYIHGVEDIENIRMDNCTVLEKQYQSDTKLLVLKCSFKRGREVHLKIEPKK